MARRRVVESRSCDRFRCSTFELMLSHAGFEPTTYGSMYSRPAVEPKSNYRTGHMATSGIPFLCETIRRKCGQSSCQLLQADRAGFEPARPWTPTRQSDQETRPRFPQQGSLIRTVLFSRDAKALRRGALSHAGPKEPRNVVIRCPLWRSTTCRRSVSDSGIVPKQLPGSSSRKSRIVRPPANFCDPCRGRGTERCRDVVSGQCLKSSPHSNRFIESVLCP